VLGKALGGTGRRARSACDASTKSCPGHVSPASVHAAVPPTCCWHCHASTVGPGARGRVLAESISRVNQGWRRLRADEPLSMLLSARQCVCGGRPTPQLWRVGAWQLPDVRWLLARPTCACTVPAPVVRARKHAAAAAASIEHTVVFWSCPHPPVGARRQLPATHAAADAPPPPGSGKHRQPACTAVQAGCAIVTGYRCRPSFESSYNTVLTRSGWLLP